jgi:Putative metal-binding motif
VASRCPRRPDEVRFQVEDFTYDPVQIPGSITDGDFRPLLLGYDMGADEYDGPCWDLDGDGYGDERCGLDDCDDADSGVNPGQSEICGNDIDDNCNGRADENWPCTATATASTVCGAERIKNSSILNNLAFLLIPIGAVISLKIWRRKR